MNEFARNNRRLFEIDPDKSIAAQTFANEFYARLGTALDILSEGDENELVDLAVKELDELSGVADERGLSNEDFITACGLAADEPWRSETGESFLETAAGQAIYNPDQPVIIENFLRADAFIERFGQRLN